MKVTTIIAPILAAAPLTVLAVTLDNALGINCRGSNLCATDASAGNMINLKNIVDGIQPRNRVYGPNQPIACTGNLCAFYQNGATKTAEQTSQFMQMLLNNGCSKCGSVPTEGMNDVRTGELTVNIMANPKCQGAC